MDTLNAPLLSSKPDFPKIRPDLSKSIDAAEIELRRIMRELLVDKLCLPEHVVADAQQQVVIDTPAGLLRALLPIMGQLSGLLDYVEMVKKLQARGGRTNGKRGSVN